MRGLLPPEQVRIGRLSAWYLMAIAAVGLVFGLMSDPLPELQYILGPMVLIGLCATILYYIRNG